METVNSSGMQEVEWLRKLRMQEADWRNKNDLCCLTVIMLTSTKILPGAGLD